MYLYALAYVILFDIICLSYRCCSNFYFYRINELNHQQTCKESAKNIRITQYTNLLDMKKIPRH